MILKYFITAICLLCSFTNAHWGYRLSNDTVPLVYDLTITIDLDAMKFDGIVSIVLTPVVTTSLISLNYKDITVDSLNIELKDDENKILTTASGSSSPTWEVMFRYYKEELIVGRNYTLKVAFNGTIKDDLQGLYRSSYYAQGEKRYIATTFLAAANARKIFPCHDEPKFKAKFNVHIYHSPNYHALSNMDVKNTTYPSDKEGLVLTSFHETPIMSTYLLAMILSDFSSLKLPSVYTYSTYAQKKNINSTKYALEFSEVAVNVLQFYFKRPYLLPKIDVIAIDDFLMGAMENWGLLTFKTSTILYDKGLHSTFNFQKTTQIVLHELVHQWFGNEVTCNWWSEVWLNEGFTKFFEYYILDMIHPDWRMMDQFVLNEVHPTFLKDVDVNATAMTRPITKPSEIARIYDYVTYPKAASVIRMMQAIVGKEVFDNFVRMYLKDRSLKTVTEEDVFRVLQESINLYSNDPHIPPIATVMKSWTNNPGFPLVKISRVFYSDDDDEGYSTLFVNQQRLNYASDVRSPLYYIPLNYASKHNTHNSTTPTFWLKDNSIEIVDRNLKKEDWFVFNIQQTGYYRVNYDLKSWKLIAKALQSNLHQIHPLNRAQVIDDALVLMKENYTEIEVLLEILNYFEDETDLIPLKAGFIALDFLNRILFDSVDYLRFQDSKLLKIYKNMEKNTEKGHFTNLYKREVTTAACRLEEKNCIKNSAQYVEKYNKIPVDLRRAIICGINKNSGEKYSNFFKKTFERFELMANNVEKKRYNYEEFNDMLVGLSCTLNENYIENYLQIILRENELEMSECLQIFEEICASSYLGTETALNYVDLNIGSFNQKFGSIIPFVKILPDFLVRDDLVKILVQIRGKLEDADTETRIMVEQTIKKAEDFIIWENKNIKIVESWFNSASTLKIDGAILYILTLIWGIVNFTL